jgi:hypothetical protein
MVSNTYILSIDRGSVKRRWVGKRFTDATYPDHSGGSVKVFTDRWRVGKTAFTDPPLVANNEL